MGGLAVGTFVLVASGWSAARAQDQEAAQTGDDERVPEGSGAPPAEVSGRVRGLAQLSTAWLAGPASSPATVTTETDTVEVGGFFNPRLRVQIVGLIQIPVATGTDLLASWGLSRDVTFCDTCGDGPNPGLGRAPIVSSRDVWLSLGRIWKLGKTRSLRLAVQNVVPASRDSLLCNPLIAAPGVGVRFTQRVGRSSLWATGRLSRPIHASAAAPVGRCGRSLTDPTVDTLAGPVSPTPWDGAWSADANPALQTSLRLQWFDAHALLGGPKRLRSVLALGLEASRVRRQSPDGSRRPLVGAVPFSAAIGWTTTEHLDLQLSVSNQTPTLIADGLGNLAALPARTTTTLSAIRRF